MQTLSRSYKANRKKVEWARRLNMSECILNNIEFKKIHRLKWMILIRELIKNQQEPQRWRWTRERETNKFQTNEIDKPNRHIHTHHIKTFFISFSPTSNLLRLNESQQYIIIPALAAPSCHLMRAYDKNT